MERRSLAIGGAAGLAIGAGAVVAAFVANGDPGQAQVAAQRGQPVIAAPSTAPQSFSEIIDEVAPAVVSVHVLAARGAGPPAASPFGLPPGMQGSPNLVSGLGSGFIISPDGYIVTNNHVIAGSREILVALGDDRELAARVVGRDEATDLAVLKVEARGLPFVSFENAARPEVGDWVLAVGSPFGLGGTATAGIVSAYAREIGEAYVTYIQTDAAINQGNSGGPMFDVHGRVIGVNTAIVSPTGGSVGIGFAIPADVAERVTGELIEHGRVTRGYIGASIQTLTPLVAQRLGLGDREGALIAEVSRSSPAAAAGLRPGDLVVAVDGQAVTTSTEFVRRVAAAKPGQELSLQVVRGGRARTLTVRAGVRPS